MKRTSCWKQATMVFGIAAALFVCGGCSVNQSATDACKDSPSMGACKSCCTKNGASGHSAKYVGDTKECKCLGGG